jgi:signal peptidase
MVTSLQEIIIFLLFFSFCTIIYLEAAGGRQVSRYLNRQIQPELQWKRYRRSEHAYLKSVKPARRHLAASTIPTVVTVTVLVLFGTKSLFLTAVISGSMAPTFERGDLVLMQSVYKKVHEGDIIMFDNGVFEYPIIHRAVKVDRGSIRTKGDANSYMDWWTLNPQAVKAKAVTIAGKPIVIRDWGTFFILEKRGDELLPLFGEDYRTYQLFFTVLRIYGLVISIISIVIYISLAYRDYKNG